MRCKAWMKTATTCSILVLGTAVPVLAESFLPRALAPEHGIDVMRRTDAERLVGRQLLAEPAGSALWGEVHLYDRMPYIEARYVHVTSDAAWQRLLFGTPGEVPRAFGQAGEAPGEFREPRGMAFAPDGRLFVTDRVLGRVTVLQARLTAAGPELTYLDHIDGLVQPMDVAVHDGGTPAIASDDRLLVAEAGAHRVSLFALDGNRPARLAEFGAQGPLQGQFLYPRTLAVGRVAGSAADVVFVGDSGNHRLVRLQLRGTSLSWDGERNLPMEATSVDTDHHGNLLVTLRRQNDIWKLTADLEPVATFQGARGALQAPRDVAIPFVWLHDHRQGNAPPQWRGQGSALVLEAWSDVSGVRQLDLGVEIVTARAVHGDLELTLTDAAHAQARVVDAAGRASIQDLGTLPAGTQKVHVPGLAEAAQVEVTVQSLYDSQRQDAKLLELSAVSPSRLLLLQNHPNPFNPNTTIAFELPVATHAVVEVFDVRGRSVKRLLDRHLAAGRHDVVWDGRDRRGRSAASGVYFYRLNVDGQSTFRKMVLAQ
jgi:hypothetical protein